MSSHPLQQREGRCRPVARFRCPSPHKFIVDSPSGRLGDSRFAITDKAAHVCPVGAILSRRAAYRVPIGERLYDREPIAQLGDVADHDEE